MNIRWPDKPRKVWSRLARWKSWLIARSESREASVAGELWHLRQLHPHLGCGKLFFCQCHGLSIFRVVLLLTFLVWPSFSSWKTMLQRVAWNWVNFYDEKFKMVFEKYVHMVAIFFDLTLIDKEHNGGAGVIPGLCHEPALWLSWCWLLSLWPCSWCFAMAVVMTLFTLFTSLTTFSSILPNKVFYPQFQIKEMINVRNLRAASLAMKDFWPRRVLKLLSRRTCFTNINFCSAKIWTFSQPILPVDLTPRILTRVWQCQWWKVLYIHSFWGDEDDIEHIRLGWWLR